MRKLMRFVLEELQDKQDDKRSIVMSGPLSDIYTKALDEVYAKPDVSADDNPEGFATALESQQQDATIAQTIANAINQEIDSDDGLGTDAVAQPFTDGDVNVYGVAADNITPDDIINVANGQGPAENWVVIVDATRPSVNGPESAPTQDMINLASAMENMITKMGGHYYHSLEAFVEDVTKPKTSTKGNGDPSAKPNHGYLNEKGTDGNGGADGTGQDGVTGIDAKQQNPGADGTSTNGEDNATGQGNTVDGEGIDTNNPQPGTDPKKD